VRPIGFGLSALGKSAEVTGHAPFLKTDGLAAFGAGFPQKAFFILAPFGDRLTLQISFLQDPADGIGNGEHQAVFLKNGVFTPIPLSCSTIFSTLTPDRRARETRRPMASVLAVVEPPGFSDGGKDFEGPPFKLGDGHVKGAHARGHFGGEPQKGFGSFLHGGHEAAVGLFSLSVKERT
jgi:hypothetical protein